MGHSKFLLCVFLSIFILASSACSNEEASYSIKTLENGLTVIVIPNHKAPVISHMVWYKVGSIDEPKGKSGLAHFLEHMMFKGTKNVPGEIFSRKIALTGGNDNAFTSYDVTSYYQTIPKDKLAMVMQLEADRMHNIIFEQQAFEKEKQVILEERRMRVENSPSAILSEKVKSALLDPNPYHIPIIGWQHEIEALDLDTMKRFYKEYYKTANAVLVIAGDIKPKQAFQLASLHYGALPTSKEMARRNVSNVTPIKEREIVVEDSRVILPEWTRYYRAPSMHWGNKKDVFPLIILASVLGDGETSLLYQQLARDKALVSGINVYYQAMRLGPSNFSFHAVPKHKGVSLDTIESAIDEAIDNIITNGIDAEEIERVKQAIIAANIYAREDLKTLGYYYGLALSIGIDPSVIEDWDKHIKAVTPEQVATAAKQIFHKQQSVTGRLIGKSKEVK